MPEMGPESRANHPEIGQRTEFAGAVKDRSELHIEPVIDLRDARPATKPPAKAVKVALAHDYLTQRGGAERVVLHLLDAFPDAALHTSFFLPDGTYPEFDPARIRTLPLNRVRPLRTFHRAAFPVLASAWSSYRVEADVVLASSSGWSHGVQTDGRKIVYCHAPARWLHQPEVYLNKRAQRIELMALSTLKRPLKSWDRKAARSADRYLANSGLIRDQIRRVYGIDAEIVPPPVSVDTAGSQEPIEGLEPGFDLCVSRLMSYKNIDVLLAAFRTLRTPLVIVGVGPEADRLRAVAPSNVRFLGRVSDAELRWLYSKCSTNLSVSFEDFGLVTVEAAAFGKPTVGLRYGGFLDTVVEGSTGLLFDEPDPSQVVTALRRANRTDWSATDIAAHAAGFSVEAFHGRLRQIVADEASLA